MFNSLWIDTKDAQSVLENLEAVQSTALLGERLRFFWTHGYCIIPDAIPSAIVDKYLEQYRTSLNDGRFKASYGHEIFPAHERDLHKPLTKILDTHVFCDAAQEMAFAPPITSFLEALFRGGALAFQSLHFEVGSTQAVHQDTAYVVVEEPKSFAAIWIALEDIQPGTGELVYYPGSHRFGDFLYPGRRKHWDPSDGPAIHNHHLYWLHEEAKRQQIALASFLPKKGSALIWHADLAHGGGTITRPGSTRRSLVVHYCPARYDPVYFRSIATENRVKRSSCNAAGYISTMYY
jgi:phytanoyl-CoA hydroxylase